MRRVPELLVERLALEELDEARARAVREELSVEEQGLERLSAVVDANEAHRDAPVPLALVLAVQQERRRKRTARMTAVSGLALAACALLAVPTLLPSDSVRTKGLEPHLQVLRKEASGLAQVHDGDLAARGDRLQLLYVAAEAPFGAVLSVDGRGVFSQHLPQRGDRAVALAANGAVALPSSYLLDDAPDFERFFLVTGPRAFALEEVEPTLKAWGAPDARVGLPADLTLSTLTLRKAPP